MMSATPINRTIVRFTATAGLGLAGCVSVEPRPQALDPRCPVDTGRICVAALNSRNVGYVANAVASILR